MKTHKYHVQFNGYSLYLLASHLYLQINIFTTIGSGVFQYSDSSNKPACKAGNFSSLRALDTKICKWKAYHIASTNL